ncbi:MAG TPA: adenylosuccinate lyase family protein [bacterium]|nr:adenylosuccinate lyase family protein [bacterium]
MSHLLDSRIYRDMFGTTEMRDIFTDRSLVQTWLDVEVALARAGAVADVIPLWAAEEIACKARIESIDFEALGRQTEVVGYPILPLIRILAAQCEKGAGEYVHWGATTQDIMDTAVVLQLRRVHGILTRDLQFLIDIAADLAKRYRDTLMAGRTHGQHALPITFGFKVAVWIAELARHRERLQSIAARLFVGQFAGAAGTLASLGAQGLVVQREMMRELGLGVPSIAWHVARDVFVEFVTLLALISGTIAKIGQEIALLQKTEVSEVEEGYVEGRGGSSTMPQKRNPITCEVLMALGAIVAHDAALMYTAMHPDHERATGPWHVEWEVIPEACILAGGALHQAIALLRNLIVRSDRMILNLNLTKGLIGSEAVLMALAPTVGRQRAHGIIYRAAMTAVESGRSLEMILGDDQEVRAHLSLERIRIALDPSTYSGLSGEFVDRVLATVGHLSKG